MVREAFKLLAAKDFRIISELNVNTVRYNTYEQTASAVSSMRVCTEIFGTN